MRTHKLYKEQLIKSDIDTVWDFFSSPENLDVLTPDNMGFEIKTPLPLPKMYQGQIIEYTVRPILNLPLFWRTEITEVENKKSFVDEQRKGPYKLWRHKHIFEVKEEGVRMLDNLEYTLPLGPLGSLAQMLFVKNRIQEIFDFRYNQIDKIFNKSESTEYGAETSSIQRGSTYKAAINIRS